MRASYSSFHSQMRSTSAVAAEVVAGLLLFLDSRFSTTAWVAMPAWSMPGIQRTSKPCIRRQRIRMSWSVSLIAWPRCSAPVTFGGGITMQ